MGFIITCCNTTQTQNKQSNQHSFCSSCNNLSVCLLLILLCPSEKIYTAACANRYRAELPASLLGADVTTPVAITCHNRLSRLQSVGKKTQKEVKKQAADQRWEYISQRSHHFLNSTKTEINMLSSTMSYSQVQKFYPLHLASPTPKGRRKKKKNP